MAFPHVHDPVRAFLAKPEHRAGSDLLTVECGAAAAARGREMGRVDDPSREALPRRGKDHPLANELGERGLVEVLELAAAAFREMATGRFGMVWADSQAAVRQD